MKQAKEKIAEVLTAFVQQELGNRISQFNMQGLTHVIFGALDELEVTKPDKED